MAAAAFAALLDRPMPPTPDLAGRDFDRVLFLHVAALAAVYDEASLDLQALF